MECHQGLQHQTLGFHLMCSSTCILNALFPGEEMRLDIILEKFAHNLSFTRNFIFIKIRDEKKTICWAYKAKDVPLRNEKKLKSLKKTKHIKLPGFSFSEVCLFISSLSR